MLLSSAIKKPSKASKQTSAPTVVAPPPAPSVSDAERAKAVEDVVRALKAAARQREGRVTPRYWYGGEYVTAQRLPAYMRQAIESDQDDPDVTSQEFRAKGRQLTRMVSYSYRSDLPKEGAYDVGYSRYEEMVRDEIRGWRSILDPHLAPYRSSIKNVRVYDGEKSWIYTDIELN